MEIRRPQNHFPPFTHAEVETLRKEAARPDYGSNYYKPVEVLRLIATIDALTPKQLDLFTTGENSNGQL